MVKVPLPVEFLKTELGGRKVPLHDWKVSEL